jgi:phage terminase Nu1 subunit (DNA packaging protein)
MTQAQFAELVGVSQQAISALVNRGILSSGDTGAQWLRVYCENLREQAAGRSSSCGGLDLVQERARLAKEQADKVAMANSIERRELASVHVLEIVLAKVGRQAVSILEAVPVQLKRNSVSITADDLKFITTEIVKARNVIASMNLTDEINGLISDTESD